MTQTDQLVEVLDARVRRRDDRREFFKAALNVGGFAVAGAAAMGLASAAEAQATAPTEGDVLNFALNLEYLEAQFYSYAAFGTGLPANMLDGSGAQGAVITGTGPGAARKVTFTDPAIAAYAREIAADEVAHVTFLRNAIGATRVSQPTIDISGAPGGAFAAAAAAAQPALTGFDPYLDDNSFLQAAFIFEDVGVTAYKGSAGLLINNKTFLEAAAGILAVEAYHAAIVRTALYARGATVPALRTNSETISNLRDAVDGPMDLDQGVAPTTVSGQTVSNIAPLDPNGLAYSRSAAQVLNIVYLNRASVTMGGFFPNGVNGTIRASAAN